MNRAQRRAQKRKKGRIRDPQIEQYKQLDRTLDQLIDEAYDSVEGTIEQKADYLEGELAAMEAGVTGEKMKPVWLGVMAAQIAKKFKKEHNSELYARFLLRAGSFLDTMVQDDPDFKEAVVMQNQQIELYHDAAIALLKENKKELAQDLLQKAFEIGQKLAKEDLIHKPTYRYYGRILDWKAHQLEALGQKEKAQEYLQQARKYLPKDYFDRNEPN